MPLSIRWRNFRSLADTGRRELRPLTIILGPNNSGKTSFVAPLLLLKQTITAVNTSTALLTKGPILDLGRYADLVRDHDPNQQVHLSIDWHIHGDPGDAERELGLDPPGAADLVFEQDPESGDTRLESVRVYDIYRRPMLTRGRLKSGRYSLRGLSELHLPTSKEPAPDAALRRHRARVRKAIKDSMPDGFFFEARYAMTSAALRDTGHPGDAGPTTLMINPDAETDLYAAIVDTARYQLMGEMRDITYIGPLRERARRLYLLSGEMPRDVGTRGESAPEVLFRWRRDKEKMEQVHTWLRRFGFSDTLELEPVGTGGFSLSWRNESNESGTAFVDMGFGLSQVLPLIVQGVMADQGSTIVAEQPEIHLNPRLQSVLAELFAFFIGRGVNVIVESHSEHLLLTVRRLVAEDALAAEAVALYFVERTDRRSTVREVPIEANGNIPPDAWPTGFFADALRESLALSEAQFKV